MKKAQAVSVLLVVILSALCHPMSQAMQPLSKAWTFMVYSCADCDLEAHQLNYMIEMASVGSSADVNIVVQMDRIDGYSSSYGDWTDCKRFYITQGLTPTSENAIESLGEVNMGDQYTLLEFLTWAIQGYPADRYFAMMIGHGWIDGVCFDWSGSVDALTALEIRWALDQARNTTGVDVDIIGFEACQQSATEIVYEIGDCPEVIIASEEVSTHWPYSYILSDLVASPTMSLDSIASMIVEHYSQHSWVGGEIMTIAAFNLSHIAEVAAATTDLAGNLTANLTRHGHAILRAASAAEPHSPIPDPYRYTSCRDLYDFALEIKQEILDSTIQLTAQKLIDAIESACIDEWHGPDHPDFHGLYIYLPASAEVYNARTSLYGIPYSLAHPRWTQDTTWDELLFQLFRTHAQGLRTREYITESACTSFDSDNDSCLDALHIELSVCTTGEPINVTAHGSLIDPHGDVVDQFSDTWNTDDENDLGDIYLHMLDGGEEGWYDAKIEVYDQYGIFEDELYLRQIAFLPEEMQHDVSISEVSAVKTVVGQSYPAAVKVTISNMGHYQESLNVSIYANGTLVGTRQFIIPIGNSATVTVQWNSENQEKGNYTITSYVEPVQGETNTTDNFVECKREVCVTIPGDLDADHDVDILDIVMISYGFSTREGDALFFANGDIDGDGNIDIYDIVIAADNYDKSW